MSFDSVFLIVAWCGVISTAGILATVLLRPRRWMADLNHRAEILPQVMVPRYAAQAILAVAALLSGSGFFLMALMIAFTVISLGDSLIYARAGMPHLPHTIAGLGSLVGIVALLLVKS